MIFYYKIDFVSVADIAFKFKSYVFIDTIVNTQVALDVICRSLRSPARFARTLARTP